MINFMQRKDVLAASSNMGEEPELGETEHKSKMKEWPEKWKNQECT